MTFEEANRMIAEELEKVRAMVQESLRRQTEAINRHAARGTYFFDYGNAFLLEAARACAKVFKTKEGEFTAVPDISNASEEWAYPSYVQDIMGPLCFDYGFGPFRWVCASGDEKDLEKTDAIATEVLERLKAEAPEEIQSQLSGNIHWMKNAKKNNTVVGLKARIVYADVNGRNQIASAVNDAIGRGELGPVVLGRDHHDVSGTDSPYRETSNIYDGSRFTADMAIQNVIGDSFRGATWVSIHNGGGVGWGEVINGGFGMVLDGSKASEKKLQSMLFWDVNNGLARRSWARNKEATSTITRAMELEPKMKITLPNIVEDSLFLE
jgi:urocanate hydratase